jgi:hypothetical protein
MSDQPLTVVRITAPDFVATLETADGVVRRADPAIAYLVGWTDDEVREFVYSKSWPAAIVSGGQSASFNIGKASRCCRAEGTDPAVG